MALLVHGLKLDLDNKVDRADLDECLRAAWRQIQPTLSSDPERRALDFSKTFVAPVADAFLCPITRRVLNEAPFGLTPYCNDADRPETAIASKVRLSALPTHLLGGSTIGESERRPIKYWLENDQTVSELRDATIWNNLSDSYALFTDYSRTAEHSAQQSSQRLRRYEREFKSGRINILNCSTTMEMGVDIGSVSSVMMTNVPPSIANYRQRVGRAGRRGQSLATAFTFCKDRPLDRDAFNDPATFLTRTISAPKSRSAVGRSFNDTSMLICSAPL